MNRLALHEKIRKPSDEKRYGSLVVGARVGCGSSFGVEVCLGSGGAKREVLSSYSDCLCEFLSMGLISANFFLHFLLGGPSSRTVV